MTFTPEQLFVSTTELAQLRDALAGIDQVASLQTIINEEIERVDSYTLRYELTDARYRYLVRALALHHIYSLLGPVPENHGKTYDEAMRELAAIRDGKFPDLKLRATASSSLAAATARSGGEPRIK